MRSLSIRTLTLDDARDVFALLDGARDETMFLRSNLHNRGFAYAGNPRQAKYFGAFEAGSLVGVAALCWNGMVLMHAPRGVEMLFVAVVREAMANGPAITGFNGSADQLRHVREMLDMSSLPVAIDSVADLFAADVCTLEMPDALYAPGVVLRRPREEDLAVLVDWDIDYKVEALGDAHACDRRTEVEHAIASDLKRGIDNMWLLERDGILVSRSILSASLPDMVQIGGVWTPPRERGKGYGRAVVAGSLAAAAHQGVERAVLFAHDPRAIRAYRGIGFQKVGSYMLVMFDRQVAPDRLWRLLNALPARASASIAL